MLRSAFVYSIIFPFTLLIASAQVVSLAAPDTVRPYVLSEENAGLELEIAIAAFKDAGYTVNNIKYGSNKRIMVMLKSKIVDAIIEPSSSILSERDGQPIFFSDSTLSYRDCGISLKKNNLKVKTIQDLSKYRTLAFQGAQKIFGEAYIKSINKSPVYLELPNQASQVKMLINDRMEIIISDIFIFQYYLKIVLDSSVKYKDISLDSISFHCNLFRESPRYVTFNYKKTRDNFNKGLAEIKSSESKIYENIFEKYKNRYMMIIPVF